MINFFKISKCFSFNKLSKILFYFLSAVIIIAGIYLRVKTYLYDYPFWLDDIIYSLNIMNRKILELFQPLWYSYKAAPFFSIAIASIVKLFGYSTLNFRFIPQLASILSLFAFFIFLNIYLKNKMAILFGMFLFSMNYMLIGYSCELRNYSFDVLVCILLMISYRKITFKDISNLRILLYSLLTVFLMLTSFPVMFTIPSIVIAKSIEEKYFNPKTLFILFSLACVCIYLYLIDRELYKFMDNFWSHPYYSGFIKPSFDSFIGNINNMFIYQFISHEHPYWLEEAPSVFDNWIKLLKLFSLAGIILFFKERKSEGCLFLFIFLFVIMASVFKIYPLSQRHSLHIMPLLILLIAKTTDFSLCIKIINDKLCKTLDILKSVLIIIFLLLIMDVKEFPAIKSLISSEFQPIIIMRTLDVRNEEKNLTLHILKNYNEENEIILSDEIMDKFLDFYNVFEYHKSLTKDMYINFDNYVNNEEIKGIWLYLTYRNINIPPSHSSFEEMIKSHNFKYKKISDTGSLLYYIYK